MSKDITTSTCIVYRYCLFFSFPFFPFFSLLLLSSTMGLASFFEAANGSSPEYQMLMWFQLALYVFLVLAPRKFVCVSVYALYVCALCVSVSPSIFLSSLSLSFYEHPSPPTSTDPTYTHTHTVRSSHY
jgi:hypothetical protein